MLKKKCCPVCGGEGIEVRRVSDLYEGKLVERVTMTCQIHREAVITWSNYDDAIRHEATAEARTRVGLLPTVPEDVNTRGDMEGHPEHVGRGRFAIPSDALVDDEVDVVPTSYSMALFDTLAELHDRRMKRVREHKARVWEEKKMGGDDLRSRIKPFNQ
mgnify:CR=1 FL=1